MLCSEGDGDDGDGDDGDFQIDLWKHFSYNVSKQQLRLPTSTWPPAASQWLHSRPTHQTSVAPAKKRAPMTNSASGGRGEALPGTDRSLPGMAKYRTNANPSTVVPLATHVQHPCTTNNILTHVLLYDTYCCTYLLLCTRRAGGMERRGEAKIAVPPPLWHGSAYNRYFLFLHFGQLYPPPSQA